MFEGCECECGYERGVLSWVRVIVVGLGLEVGGRLGFGGGEGASVGGTGDKRIQNRGAHGTSWTLIAHSR